MKTKILFTVLLIILVTSVITVMGQETTDKKKQEEDIKKKKERIAIIVDKENDSQKELQKAMEESLAAEEKALKTKKEIGVLDDKEFLQQAEALDDYKKKLEEMKVHAGTYGVYPNFSVAPPIKWKMPNLDYAHVYDLYSGDRENTSLTISKTLEDVTFATDFYYDVKKESSTVSFFVTGTLKAGELKIILKKPDKTAFQEITISPLADVNWNQTFSWDEDQADEYLGKWTISITASKANGNYRVQVNSR